MFVWSSIAHMATPLGEIGISQVENDAALIGAMQGAIGDKHGLFFFPSFGVPLDAPAEQREAAMAGYEAKLKTLPSASSSIIRRAKRG